MSMRALCMCLMSTLHVSVVCVVLLIILSPLSVLHVAAQSVPNAVAGYQLLRSGRCEGLTINPRQSDTLYYVQHANEMAYVLTLNLTTAQLIGGNITLSGFSDYSAVFSMSTDIFGQQLLVVSTNYGSEVVLYQLSNQHESSTGLIVGSPLSDARKLAVTNMILSGIVENWVYVLDGSRIAVYNGFTGVFTENLAPPPGSSPSNFPFDMHADGQGNLYVLYNSGTIAIYNYTNQIVRTLSGFTNQTQTSYLFARDDASGDLYVAAENLDGHHNFISQYDSNGLLLATIQSVIYLDLLDLIFSGQGDLIICNSGGLANPNGLVMIELEGNSPSTSFTISAPKPLPPVLFPFLSTGILGSCKNTLITIICNGPAFTSFSVLWYSDQGSTSPAFDITSQVTYTIQSQTTTTLLLCITSFPSSYLEAISPANVRNISAAIQFSIRSSIGLPQQIMSNSIVVAVARLNLTRYKPQAAERLLLHSFVAYGGAGALLSIESHWNVDCSTCSLISQSSEFRPIYIANEDSSHSFAYVGYHHFLPSSLGVPIVMHNSIVVSIRGTDSVPGDSKYWQDFIADGTFKPMLYPNSLCNAKTYVRTGFYTRMLQFKQNTQLWVQLTSLIAAYPSANIFITGHSLGAAVALLFAMEVSQYLKANKLYQAQLAVYNYGQPHFQHTWLSPCDDP